MKFQDLVPARTWQELILSGVRRTYRAGETVLLQGAPATSVRLLTSGRVEVGCHDEEGEYCLLALRGIGDVVGEMAAQIDGVRSATVTALEPCTAYSLAANTFHAVLTRHGAREQLGRYITGKLQESGVATIETVRLPPLQRLARLIVRLVDLADPGNPQPLRVPMSQVRMAESLGLSRSLIAQLVSELRSGGLVDTGRGLLVTKLQEVREVAGLDHRM
jgi:CRP/FNR family cyclic AMP-dependent transcriptional regulator